MDELQINTSELDEGVVLVKLNGVLDSMILPVLEKECQRYFDNKFYKFLFDISELSRISSSGAGFFVKMVMITSENYGGIVLVQPSHDVREVLVVLGIASYLPIVDKIDAGLKLLIGPRNKPAPSEIKLVHRWASGT